MKRIVFKGYLEKMYPEGIEVAGDTAAECISALRNFVGFREQDGVRHQVILPQFGSRDALYARTDAREILVVPMLLGAGGDGMGQIVLGVILIGLSFVVPGPWSGYLFKAGVGLVIGGVVKMLMPQPESRGSGGQEEKSDYLPANRNTTKIGTRIPLMYGKRRVWGHILSFNVSATNKPQPVSPVPPGGFGGRSGNDFTYHNLE